MIAQGEKKGESSITLSINNLPAHTHTLASHTHTEIATQAGHAFRAGSGSTGYKISATQTADVNDNTIQTGSGGGGNTGSIGSGQSFSILPPAVGACYAIYGGDEVEESNLGRIADALDVIASYSACENVVYLGEDIKILSKSKIIDY